MSDKSNPYNVPTTGHVWDDNLAELTNQPPRWWTIGFHASWILVVVYTLMYPSWPLVNSHFKGLMGWTAIGEYKEDMKAIDAVRGKYEERLGGTDAAGILADTELKEYTVRSAKVLFGDNCSACHGAGGQGNPGFPVLADDDWLYGGSVADVQASITSGRMGMMPAKGGAEEMSAEEADALANAIAQGQPLSTPLFTDKGCVACHGMDGKGMQMLGSANLTDQVWRFSGTVDGVKHTILHGVNDPSDAESRNAVMPTFGGGKLSETDIKKLAVYVHQLGGGQ